MIMVLGATGNVTNTGICRNCGNEVYQWSPDGYCPVYRSDQPVWLHTEHSSGDGSWCELTKADPLDE